MARHQPTTRVEGLLRDLRAARFDLWQATSKEIADAARAEIKAVKHSLWLAGYNAESV